MADAVDLISWGQFEHNYGSADDVPGLLRRMREPDADVAQDAAAELLNLLYHQGGWICSAASAALPFLLDIAGVGTPITAVIVQPHLRRIG